ncbi:MAG: protein kinase [Anaerolineae bacterium]|nr:protein kinase [Anaerolineae bacterium]
MPEPEHNVVTKGQVLNARYRLLSLEGEGAMADVYKAQDTALERIVALKILRPEYAGGDAFRREARAAASLPHPNIVAVYDVGRDGDVEYIVMEYAQGQTLKEILQGHAPLRMAQTLEIAIQVCDALGAAHAAGIIHCDVKPQNILVQRDGRVKVTDFGIARALSAETQTTQVRSWGTPYYASPELVSGKTLVPASDVYAVGVLLYEMLCGKCPFDGATAAEIARQHVVNAPPPLEQHNPRVPRHLRHIVDRCLAKDPASRYPTAQELGSALRAYRQHSASVTQPLEPVQQPTPQPAPTSMPVEPVARRKTDWLMLLLAALAFLSVMGLLPLWGTVLTRALTPQDLPSPETPLATPTPTYDLASLTTPAVLPPTAPPDLTVPPLTGEPIETARRIAEEDGLVLAVSAEEHSSDIPLGHVVVQDPLAGARVPPGTRIQVTVSLGPETVLMPDTIGFPAEVKRLDLEDLGLIVVLTETASIEPAGLVISQTPPAGAVITVGHPVTLAYSIGPQDEVGANYADRLTLERCEVNSTHFRPGEYVQLLVTWHVVERMPDAYTTFIHIVDRDGRILTQVDQAPLGGSRPTNTWLPGETFLDPYVLALPANARSGDYWVHIGLYRGDYRLPVVDPGLGQQKENAVIVRQITVGSN